IQDKLDARAHAFPTDEDVVRFLREHPEWEAGDLRGTLADVEHNRSTQNASDLQLDLASNWSPEVDLVLKEGILACGIKGSGKTGVIARIIEQIIQVAAYLERRGIPMVIFDKEGDLESLLAILPNGRVVDAEHWYSAEEIITERSQVIVNLHAWAKS